MNHTPAQILAQWLEDNGVFNAYSSSDWPLFISSHPELPDDSACVYDTTPVQEGILQKTREPMVHFGVQLRVRSVSYNEGWRKAQEALTDLLGVNFDIVELDATSYTIPAVVPTSHVIPLGVEQEGTKRRNLFTVNFLLALRQES